MSGKRRALVIPLLLLVAVLGAACAGATSSAPVPQSAPGGASDSSKASIPSFQGTAPAEGIPSLAAADRDLIVTANVAMKSDDPWQTADAARATSPEDSVEACSD
jgi:hypothetical protein